MEQQIFNWAIVILGGMAGWILKTVWEALKDLQSADQRIVDRLSAIEILVAGKYVTRDDFAKMLDKIDLIADRVSEKADR